MSDEQTPNLPSYNALVTLSVDGVEIQPKVRAVLTPVPCFVCQEHAQVLGVVRGSADKTRVGACEDHADLIERPSQEGKK